MNFFIDFDNTLFDTSKFAREMLETLAMYISKNCNIEFDEILNEVSCKFGRGEDQIFDIYELIRYFTKKYNYIEKDAVNAVNTTIFNCEEFLYDDSIEFLKFLREQGHKIYILSYNENKVYFQTVKIAGTGLLDYIDGLITTTILKGEMPLDFSKGIFIDDRPKEIIAIYKNNPINVYRIRRQDSKYSSIEIEEQIPEFKNLKELMEELKNM